MPCLVRAAARAPPARVPRLPLGHHPVAQVPGVAVQAVEVLPVPVRVAVRAVRLVPAAAVPVGVRRPPVRGAVARPPVRVRAPRQVLLHDHPHRAARGRVLLLRAVALRVRRRAGLRVPQVPAAVQVPVVRPLREALLAPVVEVRRVPPHGHRQAVRPPRTVQVLHPAVRAVAVRPVPQAEVPRPPAVGAPVRRPVRGAAVAARAAHLPVPRAVAAVHHQAPRDRVRVLLVLGRAVVPALGRVPRRQARADRQVPRHRVHGVRHPPAVVPVAAPRQVQGVRAPRQADPLVHRPALAVAAPVVAGAPPRRVPAA